MRRVSLLLLAFLGCYAHAELAAQQWTQQGELRVALTIDHPEFMAPVMVSQNMELEQVYDFVEGVGVNSLRYVQRYDHYERDSRRLLTPGVAPEQLADSERLPENKSVAGGWFHKLESMLGDELDAYGPRSAQSLSARLSTEDAAEKQTVAVIAAMIDNLNGSSDWIVDSQREDPCYIICAFKTKEGQRPEEDLERLLALFGLELEELMLHVKESTSPQSALSEQYDGSLIASWEKAHPESFSLKLRLNGHLTWDGEDGQTQLTVRIHEILNSKES